MHPFYTRAAAMIGEIAAAGSVISKFLRTEGLTSQRQLQPFSQSLQELLAEPYKHHWFPEKPGMESGYRCIRSNHQMDPLIAQAAQRMGLSTQELFRLLPRELTRRVDPAKSSPAGGSTQTAPTCKWETAESAVGRNFPSKNYNMMTVSG
uniref:Protein BTG1 n=1 Tax=Piliocolobus tephrosceles TaxID=591936 RepID=A0A8C9LST3_9PRIM